MTTVVYNLRLVDIMNPLRPCSATWPASWINSSSGLNGYNRTWRIN